MVIEERDLRRILSQLRDIEAHETDIGAGLQAIVDSAGSFFDVSGAGLMVIGSDDGLQAAVASDEPGRALEEVQERLGEGPCVDAVIYDRTISTEDLGADARYERLAAELVPLGVRGVLGMPIHIGGTAVGTLNIYTSTPKHWDQGESDALRAFANVAASTLAAAVAAHRGNELVQQLEYALVNRVDIERATGIVMARRGIDAVSAFNVLREQARSTRRKVIDVAQEVLAEFSPPASEPDGPR
jgi:GAF domain-containing protein